MLKLVSIKAGQEEFNSDIANSIDRKITVSQFITLLSATVGVILLSSKQGMKMQ